MKNKLYYYEVVKEMPFRYSLAGPLQGIKYNPSKKKYIQKIKGKVVAVLEKEDILTSTKKLT